MPEPRFLTSDQVHILHNRSLASHGGRPGVRSESSLEAAVAQPKNVYLYLAGDLFELSAAYAFHIAEAQAFLDGNKRTAIAAALVFLEINGIFTRNLTPMIFHPPMIEISTGELDREGMAKILRQLMS